MWDKKQNEVIQSIAIPRAVCLMAAGSATTQDNGDIIINVKTDEEGNEWGILQAPFMHKKAKTTSFKQTMTIKGDTLHYNETTMVDIYGKSFEHTDTNTLTKV